MSSKKKVDKPEYVKDIKIKIKCPNLKYCNEIVLIYVTDIINCPNCGTEIKC